MFLISQTPSASLVTTHSALTPLSSRTNISPRSRYLSIMLSCSSANKSKSIYAFLSFNTILIFIRRYPYIFKFVIALKHIVRTIFIFEADISYIWAVSILVNKPQCFFQSFMSRDLYIRNKRQIRLSCVRSYKILVGHGEDK